MIGDKTCNQVTPLSGVLLALCMLHSFLQVHVQAGCQKFKLCSFAWVLFAIQKVGTKSGHPSFLQDLVLRVLAGRLLRPDVVGLDCPVTPLPSHPDLALVHGDQPLLQRPRTPHQTLRHTSDLGPHRHAPSCPSTHRHPLGHSHMHMHTLCPASQRRAVVCWMWIWLRLSGRFLAP